RARVEGVQDLEVVDHQVEDDVDVETARGEDGETLDFEEARRSADSQERLDGRVVELDVADGEDSPGGLARFDHAVGFGEARGDGLLDEDVEATAEEGAAEVGMGDGRRGDDGGFDAAGEVVEIGEGSRTVLDREGFRGLGPWIVEADQLDSRE